MSQGPPHRDPVPPDHVMVMPPGLHADFAPLFPGRGLHPDAGPVRGAEESERSDWLAEQRASVQPGGGDVPHLQAPRAAHRVRRQQTFRAAGELSFSRQTKTSTVATEKP